LHLASCAACFVRVSQSVGRSVSQSGRLFRCPYCLSSEVGVRLPCAVPAGNDTSTQMCVYGSGFGRHKALILP